MTLQEFEKQHTAGFKDKMLLERAFIHRSYINEHFKKGVEHNERLEFLGDAVLELIVTSYLFTHYKDSNEGDLTAYRSALVNAVTLSSVAKELHFNDFMRLSKGEAKDTERARSSILADAYEAFLGALYLDGGLEEARKFVEKTLLIKTRDLIRNGSYKDAKSFVQEKAQEKLSVTPSYVVESETGPDHDKQFVMAIYFGNDKITIGKGRSKQEGEIDAAKNALLHKGWNK